MFMATHKVTVMDYSGNAPEVVNQSPFKGAGPPFPHYNNLISPCLPHLTECGFQLPGRSAKNASP